MKEYFRFKSTWQDTFFVSLRATVNKSLVWSHIEAAQKQRYGWVVCFFFFCCCFLFVCLFVFWCAIVLLTTSWIIYRWFWQTARAMAQKWGTHQSKCVLLVGLEVRIVCERRTLHSPLHSPVRRWKIVSKKNNGACRDSVAIWVAILLEPCSPFLEQLYRVFAFVLEISQSVCRQSSEFELVVTIFCSHAQCMPGQRRMYGGINGTIKQFRTWGVKNRNLGIVCPSAFVRTSLTEQPDTFPWWVVR